MSKKQQKRTRRIWKVGVFVVLFLAAALVVFLVGREMEWWGCADGDLMCAESENRDEEDDEVEEDIEKDDAGLSGGEDFDTSSSSIEAEKNVVHDKTPTGETLGVWVTSKSVSGGMLRIRVQIDQNISSGTCALTIGGYSKEVPVIAEPQSASCQGFDVPVGEYSGNSFVITVKSGGKSGSVSGVVDG